MDERITRRSRRLYIIEAGVEYFISILVAGAYLARLTSSVGMSDALTGVISAFISLGCIFQLIAIFIRRKSPKRTVIIFSIANQALFSMLYLVPLLNFNTTQKSIIFAAMIFLAYFIYYIAHPIKINWLMSNVENEKRGEFTAKKEVVSLISGMAFSYAMGAIMDYYVEINKQKTAFIIGGIVMALLMIFHTVMLIFVSEEKDVEVTKITRAEIRDVLKSKGIIKVTVIFALWNIATYSATPFYGTYQNKELGFSLKFVAILGIIYAIARSIFSVIMGKLADKSGFTKMIRLCFFISALAFLTNTFCVPENGKIVFTAYYTLYAIAMAGINSALINLCYDYVAPDKRTAALAITQSIAGILGFIATLLFSLIVNKIQQNGNKLFGIDMYAQQFVSFFAFIMTLLLIVLVTVFLKDENKKTENK